MNSYDVTHCSVRSCVSLVTVIVGIKAEGQAGRPSFETLFGYCEFHSLQADQLFSGSVKRTVIRGVVRA